MIICYQEFPVIAKKQINQFEIPLIQVDDNDCELRFKIKNTEHRSTKIANL